MNDIKDRSKNPGYSRFTQQLFMSQLSDKEFSVFQEKMFRFPGFYVQKRSIRQYQYPNAAHILGDVGEVSPSDIEDDDYYQPGDYIGKLGVERSYEKQLRGEKGMQILLRDAHGRIKGSYQNGELDRKPVPGKNLTLGIDYRLQALGERLMEGKIGSIVAIEPSTGEVLCMVSSPTYDPRMMVGRQRSKSHKALSKNVWKPLLNRSIMGQYPPGSTFKTTQALTFLTEGIITPQTAYSCHHGFVYKGLRVGCHGHGSPLPLVPAISTSCNGYFCWGLYYMMGNRKKYPHVQDAMNTWRDYMVSMGFGYKLGIDLPGEKRGLIPNAEFYDKAYKGLVERTDHHLHLHRTGRGERHAPADSQPRRHHRQPRLLHHAPRGEEGGGRTARHHLHHATPTPRPPVSYDYIVAGMRSAVERGTCRSANRGDYAVCGKTGTAQNRGHDHSVFMGFAPMNEPKIAVAVYVENGGWGADYGVPLGALIMEKYINGKLSAASEGRAAAFQKKRIYYGNVYRKESSASDGKKPGTEKK